jgi:hypothetical protein
VIHLARLSFSPTIRQPLRTAPPVEGRVAVRGAHTLVLWALCTDVLPLRGLFHDA